MSRARPPQHAELNAFHPMFIFLPLSSPHYSTGQRFSKFLVTGPLQHS